MASTLHSANLIRNRLIPRPRNIIETGLSQEFIEELIGKHLFASGAQDLQQLSISIGLSGNILETILAQLKNENQIETRAATDTSMGIRYLLTDKGTAFAVSALIKSGYTGPAPVPMDQYRKVIRSQSVTNCKITKDDVEEAFKNTTIDPTILNQLGPALHSGRAIMIYGLPGTGKTYICKRLTRLLGESIFIPYAISVGESVVQVYDPVVHRPINENETPPSLHIEEGHDPRYIECYRPVAISGGELTLDMLEIEHDVKTRLSQAPLQLKANNGMYIIDDLGRQRVPPIDLFNRWIVPLEEKHDYLTLDTGKRFQVPFDVILIFSANINPSDLADDAFLRRIGYKIKFSPINKTQYKEIWALYCRELEIDCPDDVLAETFQRYQTENRLMLPCHPRDLLGLIRDQSQYEGDPGRATSERLKSAWSSYFINLLNAKVN